MTSTPKTNGAAVSVTSLHKTYGSFVAVNNVSLEVKHGEFLALLGPSGSGKSTILMSIAGFESPSAGDITLNGRRINDLPPHQRNIGMVFQRYALFPHLTVAENVAYPLRRRGIERAAVEREVRRALEMVRLEAFGGRYPAQLSGGQQQRVALARALVFRPPVLLMDEPLGALDRKLRQQMQMEIKLIHREIGTTIILVTHDQEEALSMADRVAVLNKGSIQQVGSPTDLYERPANAFVADFIGETNLCPVRIVGTQDGHAIAAIEGVSAEISVPIGNVLTGDPGKPALLGIRPEHLTLAADGEGPHATVIETAYAGSTLSVLLAAGPHRLTARVPASGGAYAPGDKVSLGISGVLGRIYPFDDAVGQH